MTRYELLLFVHVVGVIVWLGSGTALALIALYAQRSGDRELLSRLGGLGRWLGPRVFAPAALVVLLAGLALVHDGSWSFRALWIKLGLTAFAVTLLTNAVRVSILRRPSPAAGRRLGLVARLDLAVLYLAVADMVAKPTADDVWTLAVGGGLLALVAASVAAGMVRT
jgi:uncharacterized membrane protein